MICRFHCENCGFRHISWPTEADARTADHTITCPKCGSNNTFGSFLKANNQKSKVGLYYRQQKTR